MKTFYFFALLRLRRNAVELLESHSYKEVVALTGISKSTLIRAKAEKKAAELAQSV